MLARMNQQVSAIGPACAPLPTSPSGCSSPRRTPTPGCLTRASGFIMPGRVVVPASAFLLPTPTLPPLHVLLFALATKLRRTAALTKWWCGAGTVRKKQTRQMVGMADKTVDLAFDDLATKFKLTCDGVAKLEKAAKFHQSTVMSTMSALSQAKMELERTFPADQRQALELYDQAVQAVLESAKPKFGEVYDGRAFTPLETYKQDLAAIGNQIKERAKCQIDYDIARRKVKDLIAKPSRDPAALQQAETTQEASKAAYETINEEMKVRLQNLQDARPQFFAGFLKGVMEASATYTSQANKQIMPRLAPLGDYIATIPPPSGTEAQDINIDLGSPNAAAAGVPSQFGGAAAPEDDLAGPPITFDPPPAAAAAAAAQYNSASTFGQAAPQADAFGMPPPPQQQHQMQQQQQMQPAPAPAPAAVGPPGGRPRFPTNNRVILQL
eukprot:SAG22_NODE_539_length_9317_cov_4.771209_6_plen_440_part_00